MKRVLSYLLVVVLIFSSLCSFFFVKAAKNGPYSGGSGTADDPFLISTSQDIIRLSNNVKGDPQVHVNKLYYKLTNDISVSTNSISPINKMFPARQMTCCVGTKYTIQEAYDIYATSGFTALEKWYDMVVSEVGYLYYGYEEWVREMGYVLEDRIVLKSADSLVSLFGYYYGWYDDDYNFGDYDYYHPNFYRSAAFTGVFDGNGYSINMEQNGFLFGILENGAEIKNLRLTGNCSSLAYRVGETCKISNCIISTDVTYAIAYVATDIDRKFYMVEGGAIANNFGIVDNCVNYAKGISGLVGNDRGPTFRDPRGVATNCANYGQIIPTGEGLSYTDKLLNDCLLNRDRYWYEDRADYPYKYGVWGGTLCIDYENDTEDSSGNGYVTAGECQNLTGNLAQYKAEGFDFEKYWIMVDGIPVLRLVCDAEIGDINIDGAVNSIDSYLIKNYLGGSMNAIAYTFLKSADMNGDGEINAMDSALLKMNLAGA